MLDTYLSKLDNCLDENMSMLSARNIEFLEKILDVRHKICKAYDDNYKTNDVELIEQETTLSTKHLEAYKDDKKHKLATAITHLECYMEQLCEDFECISELSIDCDNERKMVKEKIKQIFALFT